MDEFAKLPPDERQIYFEQTAERMALPAHLIEKDFWVCWTLRVLFGITDYRDHLTFKVVHRCPRCIRPSNVSPKISTLPSVAIYWVLVGTQHLIVQGISGVERERRLETLSETCRIKIGDDFHPKLKHAIEEILGNDGCGCIVRVENMRMMAMEATTTQIDRSR